MTIASWTNPITFENQTVVTASGTLVGPTGFVLIFDNSLTHSVGPIAVTGATWSIPPTDVSALDDGIVLFELHDITLGVDTTSVRGANKATAVMNGMDISTVRNAIASVVDNVTGRCYGYVPDQPNVPCAIVYLEAVDYASERSTFDGTVPATYVIMLLAGSVQTRGGQEALDAWLSTSGTASTSIVVALESNNTLSGTIPSLLVKEARKAGTTSLVDGGIRYFSAELVVEVLA